MKKTNSIFTLVFIGSLIYSLYLSSEYFQSIQLGPIVKLSYLPIALFCFVMAAILTKRNAQSQKLFHGPIKKWLVFWVISIIIMGVNAIIKNNPVELIYNDFEGIMLLFLCIVIGASEENWKWINKLFMWLFVYGIILNVFSFSSLQSIAREHTEGSVTNKIQVFLWPVLFFVLIYRTLEGKKIKAVVLLGFFIFIVEQLLFQKRLPVARIIMTFFMLAIIQNIWKNKSLLSIFPGIVKRAGGLAISTIIIIGLMVTFGFDLYNSLVSLQQRITGNKGIIAAIIYDPRYEIGLVVLNNIISNGDYLLGKGFGGYIIDPGLWWTLQLKTRAIAGGANQVEIGHTWPLWKGGVIFIIAFNGLLLKLIFSLKKYKKDYFSLACWAFIVLHFLFLFGESYWTNPFQLYIMILGFIIGYLSRDTGNVQKESR